MAAGERDNTQDWLLPAASAPPSIRDLEHRVDEALAIARASEAAAIAIGDAAMRSAEQAQRAAESAERASQRASWSPVALAAGDELPREGPTEDRDDALAHFIFHADLVRDRLARLQG